MRTATAGERRLIGNQAIEALRHATHAEAKRIHSVLSQQAEGRIAVLEASRTLTAILREQNERRAQHDRDQADAA